MLPVGLHQDAVADLVVLHVRADRNNAADRLVTGNGGLGAGLEAGDGRELLGGEATDDLDLAGVLVELVQQLGVREADATGLYLEQHLGRPNRVDGLRRVVDDLVLADVLDCMLRGRDLGHGAPLEVRL